MKRRVSYVLMAFLGWVSITSRPFSSYDVEHQQDQISHPPEASLESRQGVESMEAAYYGNEEEYRRLSRLGSRPPSCEHKCEGCHPCDPVQIPTTTDHVGVQNANYEPEGWKCKCGASFFNP